MAEDANGHEHVERANEDRRHSGGRVTERDYFERILQERRRAHDAEHAAHDEQHNLANEALGFARRTLEQAVADARLNVQDRHAEVVRRLDTLESGGAPFASRLDDSLKTLKADVQSLKDRSIEQTAFDTLRQANTEAIERQRKQLRLVIVGASLSFVLSLVLVGIQVAAR